MFGPLDRARRLNFDVPATSPDRAFIDVRWQGPLAPTGATTTISRCAVADCTPTTLRPAGSRSGPQDFGNRFDFDRGNGSSLALRAATPEGSYVFDAEFPWPAETGGAAPDPICTRPRLGRRMPLARADRRSLVGR